MGMHNLISASSTRQRIQQNSLAGEDVKDLKLAEKNLKELVFV